MSLDVPDAATVWGWQHAYAEFTLASLYKAFPNLHVIHQVQDGRDYALSNFQQHGNRTMNAFEWRVVKLLIGQSFTVEQVRTLAYSEALGQAWAVSNHWALRWAGERTAGARGTHSVVRLEDLCDRARAHEAVQALLQNAQLPHDESIVQKAVARLRHTRCHSGSWRVVLNGAMPHVCAAMHRIDASMAAALEAFDYTPEASPELPDWLDARPVMQQLVAAALKAAGTSKHPVILTFASNGHEGTLGNWLAWLQHGKVDISHVLIVAREDSFTAVQAVAEGTGAVVFSLPMLTAVQDTRLDERGREVRQWRNIRARVWLERVRATYAIIQQGLSVLQSDLDAIWVKDPLPYVLNAAAGQAQGFDVIASRGIFVSEVYRTLNVAGCLGFAFLNATTPMRSLLHSLLREKLRHLKVDSVEFFNDQDHLNQALVEADLAYNVTLGAQGQAVGSRAAAVAARKLSTAPVSLRALFMPMELVPRWCSKFKKREAYLRHLNLWRELKPAKASSDAS